MFQEESFRKNFQTKEEGNQELESIERLPKKMKNNEIKKKKIILKNGKIIKQFEVIRYFGDNIYTGKISMDEAEMGQSNLLKDMVEFNDKSRPRKKKDE